MKKQLYIFVLSIFFSIVAEAQLPNGSTAPDWTLTDIYGNEHTLYSYLDDGYTVVLDFSATWCSPCWDYHTSGELESLFIEHGPAGMANVSDDTTDDMMVFMIEGDEETTLDELNGIGSGTMGDWVTGTPYPIIDDHTITDLYELSFYPTIYTICPDRTISINGVIDAEEHYANIVNCGIALFATDMGIVGLESGTQMCGTDYVPTLKIVNYSLDNIVTSATITASQDGTVISSYDWSGSLETYENDVFDMPEISGLNPSVPVSFAIAVEGDMNAANDVIEVNLISVGTSVTITLDILTDNYAIDTSWEIKDESDVVVASGTDYQDNTLTSEEITLPAIGCYSFTLYDEFGDGLCCANGEGYYELKDEDGIVILSGGQFSTTFDFIYEVTDRFENDEVLGVEEFSPFTSLSIYPNPVKETVNLSFEILESLDTTVEIFNILGEIIIEHDLGTLSAGSQLVTLDLLGVESGVYLVSISSEGNNSTRRITVTK